MHDSNFSMCMCDYLKGLRLDFLLSYVDNWNLIN
jgi:hypothetical protein